MRIKFTANAANSLRSISHYTFQKWGRLQRDVYLQELNECIHSLAVNPLMGRPRPELAEGLYSFPKRNHMIFYRLRKNRIEIMDVLHQSEDATTSLTPKHP